METETRFPGKAQPPKANQAPPEQNKVHTRSGKGRPEKNKGIEKVKTLVELKFTLPIEVNKQLGIVKSI